MQREFCWNVYCTTRCAKRLSQNLETLEELAIRGRESFIEAGGTDFAYLPCLNDSVPAISMLSTLLSRELAGWLTAP